VNEDAIKDRVDNRIDRMLNNAVSKSGSADLPWLRLIDHKFSVWLNFIPTIVEFRMKLNKVRAQSTLKRCG
jgi:hypothetical protein